MENVYFQDYMPGNICFGCGADNPEGLQIKSFWQGEEAVCIWDSQEKYQGWPNIANGGIMATLVDCHCMCTAMAAAYKAEGRGLESQPEYRYATGTLTIKYLKPTPNNKPLELRAKVEQIKGRKVVLTCQVLSEGTLTAEADVIAIRVYEGKAEENNPFVS